MLKQIRQSSIYKYLKQYKVSRNMGTFYRRLTTPALIKYRDIFQPKEVHAASFFVRHFSDKSSEEINGYISTLWRDHKQFDRILTTTGLRLDDQNVSMLDVGGGLTSILRLFSTPKKWVVDICIDELKKTDLAFDPTIEHICGPAEKMSFDDSFFDYIFCSNAIDHFEDPEQSLIEMKRTLKDDGYCVVTVDVFPYEKGYRNKKHPNSFTPESIKEVLAKHFTIVEYFNQPHEGKVGISQLVYGKTEPKLGVTETIFILQKKSI